MRRLSALALSLCLVACAPVSPAPIRERIYPAPQAPLSLQGLPEGARLISVTTADGLTLQGAVVEGRPDRPMLLVLHGNASSATGVIRWFAPAVEAGYGVVAAEYRGYSGNPGQPFEAGLARDADAFMAHAQSLAQDRPIWIVGHSLGGGVAMALAERSPPDVLITIGTFTRLRDMVSGLSRAAIPDAYRNIDRAETVAVPWFLIHGTADEVVPASQGSALHAAASRAGRDGASLVIEGEDHSPDGRTLFGILEAIRTRAPGQPPGPGPLPASVRVIPFGQSQPLPPG